MKRRLPSPEILVLMLAGVFVCILAWGRLADLRYISDLTGENEFADHLLANTTRQVDGPFQAVRHDGKIFVGRPTFSVKSDGRLEIHTDKRQLLAQHLEVESRLDGEWRTLKTQIPFLNVLRGVSLEFTGPEPVQDASLANHRLKRLEICPRLSDLQESGLLLVPPHAGLSDVMVVSRQLFVSSDVARLITQHYASDVDLLPVTHILPNSLDAGDGYYLVLFKDCKTEAYNTILSRGGLGPQNLSAYKLAGLAVFELGEAGR